MVINCSNCGNPVPDSTKFCTRCGSPIQNVQFDPQQQLNCETCGAAIVPGQSFCTYCGAGSYSNQRKEAVHNKTCTRCGYNNNSNMKFCIHCGTPIYGPYTGQKTPDRDKKNKKRTMTVTVAVSIILAFCMVVNFVLFPFMNSILNTSLGIFNNYGNIKTATDMPPKDGQVIAQAELSEDNLTIKAEDENVSMTISSICLDGQATAQIKKMNVESPCEGVMLTVYDFSIDTDKPLEGSIHIEIPYDEKSIAPGYTPQQCLVGIYYDEEAGNWQKAHYEIDELKQVVAISTYHLSPYGFANNIDPQFTQSFSDTVDLSKKQVFTSSGNWTDAPNFEVFYTDPEGDLMERAITYNFEVAKQNYALFKNEEVIQKIAEYGPGDATRVQIDTALSWLGTMQGVAEHGSKTLILTEIYKNDKLAGFNEKLSRVGAALSLFQLASDMYYGKPGAEAAFNFLKGMLYYKGASAVEMAFGATAGYFASWAIVGLFVFELFYGPVQASKYADMPEHDKLFGAYNTYYKTKAENGGIYRSNSDWFEIISDLNKKAMSSEGLPEGMGREEYFKELINQEIDSYVMKFWELPASDRANMVVANNDGFLYGKWGLVHFDNKVLSTRVNGKFLELDRNNEVLLWDYIENIGQIDGNNISTAEAYLVKQNSTFDQKIGASSNYNSALSYMKFFDNADEGTYSIYRDIKNEMISKFRNELLTKQIQPMMMEKQEEIFLRREDELKNSIERYRDELNKVIELQYMDESAKTMERPTYSGYIVVPNSEVLKNNKKLMDWAAVIDQEGKASVCFTTLAFERAGGFKQVAVYKPEDRNNIYEAEPALILDIVIDGDIVCVPIVDDDYTGYYKGTLPLLSAYKKNLRQIGQIEMILSIIDPDVLVTIKKDNTVIIEYNMEIYTEYTIQGAEFTSNSITDVKLNGTISEDGTITIKGSAVTKAHSTVKGEMYQEGGTAVDDTMPIDITVDAKVKKSDTGYVIEGILSHKTGESKVDIDLNVTRLYGLD